MHHRSSWRAATWLVAAACAIALPQPASAGPVRPAPALAAPTGAVIHVSTEAQLQAALAQLRSDTTIVLAPGTYVLTRSLYINGTFSRVGIRGATGNADDVVIVGRGMANASYGDVPYGIWTGGNVQDVTIANLTIRDCYYHAIIFNAGTEQPFVHNVRLVDSGQQFIKSNPDGAGGGVDGGRVQYAVIEFTTRARDDYPKGIDIHTGAGWVVRHNLFRNIRPPSATQLIGPAVLAWNRSSGTVVEGNTFINCQREIMFGVYDRSPDDHSGGIIRNNMIWRDATMPADVGIAVFDSANTQVLHNTIIMSGTYPSAIEYRYPGAMNVYIANNLADGAIRQRDGAHAVLHNNVTTAAPGLFVSPATGDLHLLASAGVAIDAGATAAGVVTDWDGDARPQGAAPDVGADERKAVAPTPTNAPPTVRLSTPTSAVTIATGSWITIAAQATDADGTVVRVDFYADATLLRGDTAAPWVTTWKPRTPGTWAITAVATDDKGAQTRSAAVSVTVR